VRSEEKGGDRDPSSRTETGLGKSHSEGAATCDNKEDRPPRADPRLNRYAQSRQRERVASDN
jgi:hypothetical protein